MNTNDRRLEATAPRGLPRSRVSAILLAGLLALAGCAIKEGATDGDGGGLVGSIKDSTNVKLNFSDTSKLVFADSGKFNLEQIRTSLKDK